MTSGKFPRGVSEFEACGLTPYYEEGFPAPFVVESHIKIGLSFEEEHLVKANGTILVVGKIEKLIVPDDAIAADGDLALESLDTVAIGGLDTYYTARKIGRYGYFKPGAALDEIS
jgi:flavin reductase (DIM6/NTAB) family NADH-FMN oxidoreductase RutF